VVLSAGDAMRYDTWCNCGCPSPSVTLCHAPSDAVLQAEAAVVAAKSEQEAALAHYRAGAQLTAAEKEDRGHKKDAAKANHEAAKK
jgi:hypothetical protein